MGKSRKSFRKAKIEDVEEALEEERLMGKLKKKAPGKGGKAGKADGADEGEDASGLFSVDTAGSFQGISRTQRRNLARAKLFPPKAPNIGLSASEELKIARKERGMADQVKRDAKPVEPDLFDLWSTPLPTNEAALQLKGRLSGESMVKRVPGDQPASAPKSLYQKVSVAPAVLPAHEGQSVNPTPAAFETLACTAAAKELEREREVESLDRQMAPMSTVLKDEFGAEAVKAMTEEEKITAFRTLVMPSQAADGQEDETTKADALIRSSKEKKQSKRNREHKRKIKEHLLSQEQKAKKLAKSVGQVGEILKEMKERDSFLAERRKFRKENKLKRRAAEAAEGSIPKHRRLGKTKFQEEALVIPDTEAAARGLRCMPIGGRTAVKDRVESIMRRGLLPAPPEARAGDARRVKEKSRLLQRTRKAVDPVLRHGMNG